MKHEYIEEHGLVERYLQGTLDRAEREPFEAHFIDCPSCLEELEWAEDLRGAVRAAVAEGVLESPPSGPVRWIRWLGSLEPAPRRALIAATLAAALLLPFFAGRYQRPAAGEGPQLNTPLIYLSAVRGDELSASLQRIYLPQDRGQGRGQSLVLVLEVGSDRAPEEDGAEFGVRLRSSGGELLWESTGLFLNAAGALTLTLPPGFLEEGDYRLEVLGLGSDNKHAKLASYAFRAVSP